MPNIGLVDMALEIIIMNATKPSTIYFDPEIDQALRLKAANSHRSISEIVNDALRRELDEDREDLTAFDERATEPTLSYDDLLNDLRAHGKL